MYVTTITIHKACARLLINYTLLNFTMSTLFKLIIITIKLSESSILSKSIIKKFFRVIEDIKLDKGLE